MEFFLLQCFLAIMLALLVCQTNTYELFQNRIPNGNRVPNPCRQGETWEGVGHQNPLGTGVRNPFGVDFEKRDLTWDECLCVKDSDGDGRTNGEELGDPACQFMKTGLVDETAAVSHPGVCEPVDDPKCLEINQWLTCESEEFLCPQLELPDVQRLTLTLDETDVPAQETTYICQHFEFPNDQDYHIIANTPEIDNDKVMHHIVAYGCPDTEEARNATMQFKTPNPDCLMVPTVCTVNVAIWSVGIEGQCLGDEYGFLIGTNGLKSVVLELHWNNPEKMSTWRDGSGLTLYYTPTLRPNHAGSSIIGPVLMTIPPQQSKVIQEGVCPGQCTTAMIQDEKIYIPEILPHMHYLGRKFIMTVTRAGTNITETVLEEHHYSYDNPHPKVYDPPLEIYPGDDVKITCEFSTEEQTTYTYFGLATSDEMCFALITYYPFAPSTSACWTVGGVAYCGEPEIMFNEKAWAQCWNHTTIYSDMAAIASGLDDAGCDASGLECRISCEAYLKSLNSTYPTCLNDVTRDIFLRSIFNSIQYYPDSTQLTMESFRQLLSCDERSGLLTKHDTDDWFCGPVLDGSSKMFPTSISLAASLFGFYFSFRH